MKRCPECRRDYYDETLFYCLDDGSRLLDGPSSSEDLATAILPPGDPATDAATRQLEPEESTSDLKGPTTNGTVEGPRRRQGTTSFLIAGVALLLAVAAVGFAFYSYWGKPASSPSQAIKIDKLTTIGQVSSTAISPDGKYVVFAMDEGAGESLWIRQVAASNNVQIFPPAEDVYYWGLMFTPDSDNITFVRAEFEKNLPWSLIQMPVLGGTQKKLFSSADGGVSYSPDGKQFAYIRSEHPTDDESALMIANADGTDERVIATRKAPEIFPARRIAPAWSPDGKTIACIIADETTVPRRMDIVEVNVADGSIKPVTTHEWKWIGQIAWLRDKTGLLVVGADKASSSWAGQIWKFDHPGGTGRRITTDFSEYSSVSLTADSSGLVTVQSNTISNIWTAPAQDVNRPVQIKSGGANAEGMFGLAWTPDGRIVYSSLTGGPGNLWIMNADGSGQKQLTQSNGEHLYGRVTPDGRYIVYSVYTSEGTSLWRMGIDGSGKKELVSGNVSGSQIDLSRDSQWVLFVREIGGNPYIYKVSIDGGEPVRFMENGFSNSPEVSPDGKWIVCSYRKDSNTTWRYAIIPIDGGEPSKVFDLIGNEGIFRWAPDGRSLY